MSTTHWRLPPESDFDPSLHTSLHKTEEVAKTVANRLLAVKEEVLRQIVDYYGPAYDACRAIEVFEPAKYMWPGLPTVTKIFYEDTELLRIEECMEFDEHSIKSSITFIPKVPWLILRRIEKAATLD